MVIEVSQDCMNKNKLLFIKGVLKQFTTLINLVLKAVKIAVRVNMPRYWWGYLI
jgi:hypothetical protein